MSVHEGELPATAWAGRAAEQSPSVRRSRVRSVERATQIVAAAHRLVAVKGADFTTQELVKEAGVATQTFYRYFAGKDHVLLAVIEDLITEACADLRRRGAEVMDPVARLRLFVTGIVDPTRGESMASPSSRFVTTEHWRLQQMYPAELATATRHYTDLLIEPLREAAEAGSLKPADVEYDAWLATQLVMAVFHHYAFATQDRSMEKIAESLWQFCSAAWTGMTPTPLERSPFLSARI